MERTFKKIRLPLALWDRLQRLAEQDKRPLNSEVELAVEEFVEREEGRRGRAPLESRPNN
jgi:predicted transcriptional regulator